MITSLQALRFIFALFVFVEHFPVNAEQTSLLHGAGPMGVSFFIVLSGFVMSIGYEKRVQEASFRWKDFMFKRLIRLWPLHLLCLGAWIILAYGAWGSSAIYPLPLLGNALLLQWLPIEHIEGNGVAWCLSVLVIFYAVYPFVARFKTRSLLLLLAGISIGLHVLAAVYEPTNTNAYWYFSPASRMLDFLLGMIAFRCYQSALEYGWEQKWSRLPAVFRWGIELLPFVLYAVALFYLILDFTHLRCVILFYLPSFLTIFLFALASKSGEKDGIPELLSKKWLIYLGQVSFSFYMVHNLVILSVKKGLEYFAPTTPWELRLVISLVGAIIAGILVNRYFETPVANRLSKLLPAKR
ncbi:acyltransferase [uncultured Porphyromonas sp.]|uniref:acyltransferase family protein n=1 Tax=uncultured Porphyromonas sp. TaxID=159274 RepID=UPI002605420F|nr:acyltransferase [uncultured Porphyromonas sp.]